MKRPIRQDQKGFTIIEFLIATSVFSVVMLLCAYAIVHVGRMYYKGVITNRTQDTARRVVEDVAAGIQFSGAGTFVRPGPAGPTSTWCVGPVRYSYTTQQSLGSAAGQMPHVLWRDEYTGADCPPANLTLTPNPGGINGQEMLGENMRITFFDIDAQEGGLYEVVVRIAYGDTIDLFVNNDIAQPCKGTNAGGQFCAVSEFRTQVRKRLSS